MKTVKGNSELMKRMNRNLMIKHIVKAGVISRSELSRATGLALPSIMRIADELIEKALIVESGEGKSTGGRKPQLLKINAAHKYIIGIEIAHVSNITLADFSGTPIDHMTLDTRAFDTPKDVLKKLLETIWIFFDKHNLGPSQVAGLGIGTPGSGFKYKRTQKRAILKGWDKIDVRQWFEERLAVPVYIDNVCRTRTLSELWFGLGKVYDDFLYAFIDQGVGTGIVSGGEIVEGHNGVAGEFGHTGIVYNGKTCYCGKKGCIEMYISAGALSNAIEPYVGKELDAHPFEWLLAHEDDPVLVPFFDQTADYIAYGLANLINLYNPPVIVLGGSVPEKLKGLKPLVETHVEHYIFNNRALKTPILTTSLENERYCLGSIALVIHRYFDRLFS